MRYKNNKLALPKEIYAAQLKKINAVALSQREIDIIACILSGRSAKGIANFLSISYKTVQVHALNAMKKLGCTSRESMIALVEKSDQFIPLKEYYLSLLTYSTFEKCLKEVAKLGSGSKRTCIITYWKIIDSPFFHHLKDHLTLAGMSILLEVREKKQPFSQLLQEARHDIYTLYALPHAWVGRFQTESNEDLRQLSQESPEYQRNILFLLWETEKLREIPQEIKKFDHLDITQQENYYFSVFAILKKILPNLELDAIFAQFEKAAVQHNPSIHVPPPLPTEDRLEEVDKKKEERVLATIKVLVPRKLGYVLAGTLSVGLLFLLVLNQNHTTTSRDKKSNPIHYQNESLARGDLLDHSVQSDLVIPAAPILLNRLELINQINDQFKQQTGQIRTVVLLGMGGSGKTTLARQYARSKETPVVWEINADTQISLVESLENLAYALSQTVEDKKALRGLMDIRNPKEREEKILFFLKERLKSYSNWFLIFDNVEKFSDIQKYFPFDSKIWGKGEILVTTQNENIPNNRHFSYMVKVGELSSEEKLDLFTKIMSNSDASSLTADQKEQSQRLLNEISSFPLDVSVAAHYLKVTNINYLKYLDNINKYKNDFDNLQSNILKEVGNYTKTRYGIITLSLKKIID
jgi:DNA-binding CsgD family transcriptional regulator